MENEAKRKLDFLKKKTDEVIDEQIRLSASNGKVIDLPDTLFLYTFLAVEYTSKTVVAQYFGTEESTVDSFCEAVRYSIYFHKTHKKIYNEIKNRFEEEYGK